MDYSKMLKSLPEQTKTFQIDVIGEVTKQRYDVEFTCKIANLRDQANISKYKAKLNAGMDEFLDIGTRALHNIISHLRFKLIAMPKFWIDSDYGYDLLDANVIEAVYAEVDKFENEWMKKVWGEEVLESSPEEVKINE